jgi:hypothetical protein
MDKCQEVYNLWKDGKCMTALSRAWQLPPLYDYPALLGMLHGDIDLRDLVVSACREAIQEAQHGNSHEVTQWLDGLLHNFSPPPALIDHGDDDANSNSMAYRSRMLYAHLRCTQEVVNRQWTSDTVSPTQLQAFTEEPDVPLGFLYDLVQELFPSANNSKHARQPVRALSLTSLLVDTVLDRGVVANLTLELMPDGNETLYPAPGLAFVARDDKFREAETNARIYVQETARLWPNNQDIRWRLERRDGKRLSSALVGDSLGGAFGLGLLRLSVGG